VRIQSPRIAVLLTLVLSGVALAGCSPKGGVATAGSEGMSDNGEIDYVYQLPPPSSTSPETPLFLVLWLGKQGTRGGTVGGSTMEVHGHPISPELDKKAVYALQPDYSLRELSLTPAEIDDLLSNRQEAVASMKQNRHLRRLQEDDVFKTKVLSQLKNVVER
jgi:hypothetical protein